MGAAEAALLPLSWLAGMAKIGLRLNGCGLGVILAASEPGVGTEGVGGGGFKLCGRVCLTVSLSCASVATFNE